MANVVVATGPYQLASVPPCSAMLPLSIHQVTASSYTRRAGNIVRRVDLQQHRLKVNIRFLCTRGGADLLRRRASSFSRLP